MKLKTLRILHGVAGGLHFAQGLAVLLLILTSKEANNDNWPLVQQGWTAPYKTWRYKLSSLLPVFPFLSAVNHFGSVGGAYYTHALASKTNPLRWGEYSLSAGVMLWIIATLSGIVEVRTLVSLMILNVALQWIGYMIEQHVARHGPRSKGLVGLLCIGFALHVAIWVSIVTSFYTVLEENNLKPPPAVYSVIWVMFVLFTSFGLVSAMYALGVIKSFEANELSFLLLSLVSKSLLTWLVYFGVLKSGKRFVV